MASATIAEVRYGWEERSDVDVQSDGNFDEVTGGQIPFPALNRAVVGSVKSGLCGKLFLRQTVVFSEFTDLPTHCLKLVVHDPLLSRLESCSSPVHGPTVHGL
jgi:hypothetical protein